MNRGIKMILYFASTLSLSPASVFDASLHSHTHKHRRLGDTDSIEILLDFKRDGKAFQHKTDIRGALNRACALKYSRWDEKWKTREKKETTRDTQRMCV